MSVLEIRAFERWHAPTETWKPRRSNAELMADCHALGYIADDTLDVTYGLGKFWTTHQPARLVGLDLNPDRCGTFNDVTVVHGNFTCVPVDDDSVDTIVLDPPYKLNGTSTGKGPAEADVLYGVDDAYVSIADRHQLIFDGITEAMRMLAPGGHLVIKCQDQVSSGRVQWQTALFADHAEECGGRLKDQLHVQGCRKQPEGRRQIHARRDYSTALIVQKPPRYTRKKRT